MTMTTAPAAQLPEPLAIDAAIASVPMGACAVCERAILRGMRFAILPSGYPAHVPCIATMAGTTSRRAS